MRAMKDSGIPWIGMIPEEWETLRLKQCADNSLDNSFIDGDWIESPVITDSGIRYLTTGNIGDGIFKEQGNGHISEATFTELNCKYAYSGDLIFSRLNSPYGRSCILPNTIDKCVLAVDNVVLRTKQDKRYICYQSQCVGFQHSVEDKAAGTTMKRISRTNLGKIEITLPPLSEQERIADFLDSKCAEIDEMIALQEKTVEELKAYKQSIITEAVTKGLNPDAPMKDSGIPWIGLIPQGWNTIRLKQLCNIKTGSQDTINRVDDGQYPFFVRSPKVERINSYCYDGEAILMAGDGVGAGRVFHHYIGKFDCHQRVYYLHEFRGINTRYLYHFLSYNFYKLIDAGSAKSTVDSVRLPMLTNFVITIPSKKEQREIVSYIDKKGQEIDSLIEIKQQKAEELKVYKKSLIYEYVTGKKEVV